MMVDNLSYQSRSHASHCSWSSNRASTAAAATTAQAKAEAAKACLAFIKKSLLEKESILKAAVDKLNE